MRRGFLPSLRGVPLPASSLARPGQADLSARRRSWGSAWPYAGLIPPVADVSLSRLVQPACLHPRSSPTVFVGFFSGAGVFSMVCRRNGEDVAKSDSGVFAPPGIRQCCFRHRRSCL